MKEPKEKLQEITRRIRELDLSDEDPYIGFRFDGSVMLDGYFTLEDLEKIVCAWKEVSESYPPPAPTPSDLQTEQNAAT